MQQNLDFKHETITVLPEPPKPRKGQGWYGIAARICQDLNTGRLEIIDGGMIYAKSLLAAQQAASKWVKAHLTYNMPIEGKWEEETRSTNKYGKIWVKKGKYYGSSNPELYVVPNQIVE